MQGSFAAAQLCTAMLWGRFSDRGGRKRILLIGLSGTMISCVGFGFSKTFWQALLFRMLGGALNGNVGVMRTMISEIVREKKYQSRAFLILPMVANIGSIIGPILGGITSDPAASYPSWFGENKFLLRFPYATPNLISAIFLCMAALAVFFGLEEVYSRILQSHDVLTHSRHMKHMLIKTMSASTSGARSGQPLADYLDTRPKDTKPFGPPGLLVQMGTSSSTTPTPNHVSEWLLVTKTSFRSVEFSLIMLSVP